MGLYFLVINTLFNMEWINWDILRITISSNGYINGTNVKRIRVDTTKHINMTNT